MGDGPDKHGIGEAGTPILSTSYVRDRKAYKERGSEPQPPGQVIVRQATMDETDASYARKSDLFIMYKSRSPTPGTDAGWTYARVSPDRRTIHESGVLPACISCHRERPDRLFGASSGR